MANIAQLPPELFCPVLDLAFENQSDIQLFCSLSLLSRQWSEALVPRIYAEWAYNGARQSFRSLWNFLRTILNDSRLAVLVHSLHIGNWGYYPHARSGEWEELNLPREEITLIREAINRVGIKHLESNIIKDIRKRDRRPLMALLLTCLPNLTRIYAHVPQSDPVLSAALMQILDCQGGNNSSTLLSKLSELYIFGEVDIPTRPRLRTLSLYGLDIANAARRLGASPAMSRLKHLSITGGFNSSCTYSDLRALLTLPEALTSFSLYVQDYAFGSIGDDMISNAGLWNVLEKHQNSLEYLDIYRDAEHTRLFMSQRHFGLLRSFSCLKKLCIQAEVLLGSFWDQPNAPYRLKDRLPCNLQSLTLYGGKRFFHISSIRVHLQEALDSGVFSSLTSVELEGFYVDSDISEVCRQNGVNLSVGRGCRHVALPRDCQLRKEGSWPQFLQTTYHMRMDGQRRAVMFAFFSEECRDRREILLPLDDSMDSYKKFAAKEEDLDQCAGDLKLRMLDFWVHNGGTAYMVFQNFGHSSLPPLFSFAIYFTHAHVSREKVDHRALYHALCDSYNNYDVRFDLYFVPGLGEEGCIAHYRQELRFRGDYKKQLKAYKESSRYDVSPGVGALPTMVHDYSDTSFYRGLLFICNEPEWNGDQKTLRSVQFDPVRQAEDGTGSSDEGNARLHYIQRHPINDSSRWYEGYDGECPIDRWISDIACWHREELRGPWLKATRRGWQSWR
ncbi:hypothetical protein ANOM_003193 [Aspergillus nomiae NRRL 13137]|uniref:F-box domain-containing protein n=1 Tax=Aspergillus nomiae NRRL (strain ATCC 15546 / NRRL 13137 / CBS 260.88 / M93) TaxID=1509407 RepID=A0A0L1JCZ4_ASPN3|nr:uncharacterized protein ANOM_003193 [Aspergillus nomiae NRRL 13137]KNG89601.1 hypothetical protein ANOM_003193 [Aspergillus nomiae NRRL 13137]